MWKISSFSFDHSTCETAASPERQMRQRQVRGEVIMEMMKQQGSEFTAVENAHNRRALQETVAKTTGVNIKTGLATGILSSLDVGSLEAELAEYAALPEFLASLQHADPQVTFKSHLMLLYVCSRFF